MIRHSRWAATALLAFLLAAAPLPFGGVLPWAAAAIVVLAFLALACAALGLERSEPLRAVAVPACALAALGAYGWLQALPWPAGLVRALSPGHAGLFARAAVLLPLEVSPPSPSLSVAPSISRTVGLTFLAAAGALVAAAVAGHSRRRRRILALGLLAGTLGPFLYGLRLWLAHSKSIWGIYVQGDSTRLRGTFVNPNHFAVWLEIALAAALALVWWAFRRARYEPRLEPRLLFVVPPVLLWLTLFVGLAFSGSRAGLAAALFGLAAQGLALGGRQRSVKPVLAVLALMGVGLLAVLGTDLRQGFGRWMASSGLGTGGGRLAVYGATWDLIERFPVFGTGLGTFREVFPLVQPKDAPGVWWHAHSDALELLLTGGIVACALALWGAWALVRRLLRVLADGERSEDKAVALAAVGAFATFAAHELVDFGLTMPANAFALVILLGAACGVALRPSPRLMPDLAPSPPVDSPSVDPPPVSSAPVSPPPR
jgi:O-antigen ligase